jgi:paraquat-inducible protein B
MSEPIEPKRSRRTGIPLVWVVPLAALGVCGWIGIGELRNRGPEITIDFADGTGIEAGKTVLEYKGVTVGMVSSVVLRRDLSGVSVNLRLNRSAAILAREGARFWIIHPELGFSGVSGLDTLLTGARLNVRPGTGLRTTHFTGLDRPPLNEIPADDRTFLLRSSQLGSLTNGAPVYYRQFKVGEVEASWIARDSTSVMIRIRIDAPYVNLVRTRTRFWNTGGFNFKVGLFGAQFSDTSLEALVAGGVSFATPQGDDLGSPALEGTVFEVDPNPDSDWLKWAPRIPVDSVEDITRAPPLGQVLPGLIKP